jgi:hypothetical protein
MNDQPSLFGGNLTSYRTATGKVVEVIQRGKHYVEPRGYADKPGTGPKDETCGSCEHQTYYRSAKRYPKCLLTRAAWTHSRRTDILVGAAACSKWKAKAAP